MKILRIGFALFLFAGISAHSYAAPICDCDKGVGLVFPACREKCAGLSLQENNPEVLQYMESIEKADSGEAPPDAQYKENPVDTDTTAT